MPKVLEPKTFSNLLDVLAHLKAEGWKIEKSKLYADAKKIGKQKDGSYSLKAVNDYARVCLQKLDGSTPSDNVMAEKAVIEQKILEEKLKALKLENEINEGKWVLKSEAEQKHTAKLALFLTAIDNFTAGNKIEAAIELIKGDRENILALREFLRIEFRALLADYAKAPVFSIPQKSLLEAEEFISRTGQEALPL